MAIFSVPLPSRSDCRQARKHSTKPRAKLTSTFPQPASNSNSDTVTYCGLLLNAHAPQRTNHIPTIVHLERSWDKKSPNGMQNVPDHLGGFDGDVAPMPNRPENFSFMGMILAMTWTLGSIGLQFSPGRNSKIKRRLCIGTMDLRTKCSTSDLD